MHRIRMTILLSFTLGVTPALADDPIPHEGAMIDVPITIEPPDVIVVEVLNAPEERPITGERLVRPDGTISLGYYGDVYIRGLTVPQAKIKILSHLRKYMDDRMLGIVPAQPRNEPLIPPFPPIPGEPPRRQIPRVENREQQIDPRDSQLVYVDMRTYTSQNYYVMGDVGSPGRLTHTGKVTVLDALQFAGGFLPTAEPTDIHLYRPEWDGKPARDFRIDLDAVNKGIKSANLQIFPRDRLVVGRNPIVKRTVEIDRANALISTQLNSVLQYALTARTIGAINSPPTSNNTAPQIRVNGQNMPGSADPLALTPAQRDAMIKDWAEFLWSISSKEGGAMLDENAFKEAWMKKLTSPSGSK
jgi:polysaccharide export outer membrane protein